MRARTITPAELNAVSRQLELETRGLRAIVHSEIDAELQTIARSPEELAVLRRGHGLATEQSP